MITIDHALKDNLEEIEKILQECGAAAIWLIEADTNNANARITFSLNDFYMMMPITDGGTLLVSFFPASPPPGEEDKVD